MAEYAEYGRTHCEFCCAKIQGEHWSWSQCNNGGVGVTLCEGCARAAEHLPRRLVYVLRCVGETAWELLHEDPDV